MDRKEGRSEWAGIIKIEMWKEQEYIEVCARSLENKIVELD